MRFSLDINSVKEIPFDKYPKNFTFIVDGQQHKTSRIFADLISPLIRQFHIQDETLDHFYIDTHGRFNKCNFSTFLSLITFEEKEIDSEYQEYFKYLFSILKNRSEYLKFSPKYTENVSVDNCMTRLLEKQAFIHNFYSKNDDDFDNEFFKDEIEFISQHFSEISKEEIKNLDLSLFEKIIQNDHLKIEDEDSLIKIINEIYIVNHKASYLYEYVLF